MLQWYEYIGFIASACIAIFTLPQLYITIKTKDTSMINLWMYIIFFIGCLCFLIDGIGMMTDPSMLVTKGIPIMVANGVAWISGSITLGLKFYNMILAKKNKMTETQWCANRLAKKNKPK